MSVNLSMSSSRMSSSSGGLAQVGGGGARVGLGIGRVSGAGLGLGLGAGSGLGLGAGSGLGLGLGAGSGLGLGLGAGSGLGLGLGAGSGLGLGAGSGLGLGAGSGLGLGFGLRSGAGLGLGAGAGGLGVSGGALVPSPAFTMGRSVAAGGLSAALANGPGFGSIMAPVLSREAEKIALSTQNDRFSVYIDKIRALQQENAMLEAKLFQLTGGADVSPEAPTTTTLEYETQLSEYRNTLQSLVLDTIKLEIELDNVRGTAHELNAKFDFEQGVKFQLEFDIAAMKKDIEAASDLRTDLNAKYSSLKNELEIVSKTQEEELSVLQSKLGTTTTDTSVSMIEVDTGKSFDISAALNKMRNEYEKSAQQHREEAEANYKLKMEEIQSANVKSSEAVSATKNEILLAKKELQGLVIQLQGLNSQNMILEQRLAEANSMSTVTVADYQVQITSLTSAIEAAKAELHRQILAYQELLDIKLALDVEISTYRKLLEGDDLKLPEFADASYTFSGKSLPKTSTPQESSLISTEIRYISTVGGKGEINQLITETKETSAISDADTESS